MPDWFRESEIDLKLQFKERNRLYALWLSAGKERDIYRRKYTCRVARQAVSGQGQRGVGFGMALH